MCSYISSSGGAWGNEDDLESRLGLLKTLTADYRTSYATKMGITEDEVDALWEKGDHWLTAQEALKAGLIDKIENKKVAITPESYMDLVACGCPDAEKFKPKNQSDMNLSKTAQLMGLPESATEAEVTAKIKELQESQGTPSDIQEAVDKVTAMHEATIKQYLDGAEVSKKINAEQRKSFETLAAVDFPKVTAIIDAMPEGGAPITEQLEPGNGGNQEQERTYAWYQQHPTAWDELVENDPEKAEALAEAHYEEV